MSDDGTLPDRLRSMVRDPDAVGTHSDECWQWHDDCALLLAADRLASLTDARPVEPWHGWLAAAELDEYPTFMDLMEMQERLAPLADYLDALGFDHDAELVRRMLFPTGTVADLRAERDDLAARLSALTDAIDALDIPRTLKIRLAALAAAEQPPDPKEPT
jgi:hypothetical protein